MSLTTGLSEYTKVGLCTCRCAAAKGRGRGNGRGDRRGEVSTGVARRSGNTAARQIACEGQRQLGLHLLLHSLMLSPCSICHEPGIMGYKRWSGFAIILFFL